MKCLSRIIRPSAAVKSDSCRAPGGSTVIGILLLGLAHSCLAQTSLTVPNYSFEYPVTSSYQDNGGLVVGSAVPGTSNTWYYLGGFIQTGSPVGVQNASANGMNGAVDGSQSVYLNNGSWIASTNLTVVQSNMTYTVTLAECNRNGFPESAGFTFGFAYGSLPGGYLTNQLIISQDVPLTTVNANAAQGNWSAYTLSFTTGTNDACLGQSLFIVTRSDPNSASFNQQVNFDNVQLTSSPATNQSPTILPTGWSDQDIGLPALTGSTSFTNGIWKITGGGTNIGGVNDQFHFAAASLNGDGMIIAQVNGQTGSDPGAQAGVMIRNDVSSGASEASVISTPGSGVAFIYRSSAGGIIAQTSVSGVVPPVWVRLSRSGNIFTAAYSSGGLNWTQIGSPQIISMTSNALAGLAVCSHNGSQFNTATFSSVLIVPGAQAGVPPGLINPYIGGFEFAGETTWPLPQLNVASNALTPRMGWNSWFVVGDTPGPSESVIKSTADALVTNGFAAAGYQYVVIDCSWISVNNRGSRDANGNLTVDPARWPSGMKAVADYVHADGLCMGGYSDIGASGYGSPAQIGGFGFYQPDANQFAAWGWDFIKIDDHGPGDFFAAASAIANNSSGRPMALSLSTPQVDGLQFATRIANSFRVHNDISFTFGSVVWNDILTQFDTAQSDWFAQAPGHWLDPDMLCVGFNGINDIEGRSQFNLWCILGASLMIGTDVRTSGGNYPPALTAATLNTLTNTEVIAVDQDALGAVGVPVAPNVYVKPLGSFTSGQFAVVLLNRSSAAVNLTVNWSDLGLVAGSSATVRDLWAHQNLGSFTGNFSGTNIPAHGSMMLKVSGAFDWNRPRIYEAESAYNSFSGTAYYIPHNTNFSSGAYVTGVGLGAPNAFQFNKVAAPSNGLYEVDIYYACGGDRTAQLSANGGTATNLLFTATGGDTNHVGMLGIYVLLHASENTLTFGNPTNVAPNFDKIVVSLGTPTGLQAVAGDGQVNLSWNSSAVGRTFNIYRGTTSGGEIFLVGGLITTNFTDTVVTNGVNYFYTVTANISALSGESPPSVEVSSKPRYATTSFAFQTALLAASPTAYWRLNETNGVIAYDYVGGYDATYGSAVGLGRPGPRPADFLGFEINNNAAQFANNVNNSWITIPALNLNTNTVTITAWIYPLGSQAAYAGLFFCRSGGTVSGMNFNSTGSDLGYTWNDNASTWGWNSGVQPPANQWSFVALIVQPSRAIIYLITTNGEQTATNVISNPNQSFSGTGAIGTDSYASAARAFNGCMDEVAVFDYALASAQLQQLYATGHRLAQVQVGLQKIGANLNLTWSQGTLMQSPTMNGPWSAVLGVPSPLTLLPTNSSMFYRVFLQ